MEVAPTPINEGPVDGPNALGLGRLRGWLRNNSALPAAARIIATRLFSR